MKKVMDYVLVAVALNLVLPFVLKRYATPDEVAAPNGAAQLSLKSQVMHMLVHHSHVPITSSLVVAVIVAASVLIADKYLK